MRYTKYFVISIVGILIILIIYMAITANAKSNANVKTIEGFSFVGKPKPTKLGERKRENFLANEIKYFAFENPAKEHMTNSPLSKLKYKSNSKANANYKSKLSNTKARKTDKLKKLAKRGKVDEFQDVLNEVDSMDVSMISVKGISDTVRRYNDNIENRLKYAKSKNNSSDLESAMAQFDVLKDEFFKIFAFTDYL